MKQQLFELLKNQGDLSWEGIVVNICMALLLGMLIYLSYTISHRGTVYSRKFNVSLVTLTVLTATVLTVIGYNISLSLGMVGALSIIRFRTAVKDSRDTVYIFWSIIVGICCGVQNYFVAAIGSTAVFVLLFVLGSIRSDRRVLVIIRGGRAIEKEVESLVFKSFDRRAILRVKNTSKTSMEYIFEISDKIYEESQKKNADLVNDFYKINEMEYVNFVLQNDDITN